MLVHIRGEEILIVGNSDLGVVRSVFFCSHRINQKFLSDFPSERKELRCLQREMHKEGYVETSYMYIFISHLSVKITRNKLVKVGKGKKKEDSYEGIHELTKKAIIAIIKHFHVQKCVTSLKGAWKSERSGGLKKES